ncbi:hypothetical protein [Sporosarcina sp. P3]|uniref:hypothetical protein n=1 Tax=Sporosarcina sp. P3 TaxID=2048245 RepID=UPI001304353F|nr:hypothetical protein [Sporosarcina sp. P3]
MKKNWPRALSWNGALFKKSCSPAEIDELPYTTEAFASCDRNVQQAENLSRAMMEKAMAYKKPIITS